ncbi:MAG: hypothetical protein HQL69_16140 [Magnetococcales bacterium]|nr:hypothetical protein [Magnetococcales bacterium]
MESARIAFTVFSENAPSDFLGIGLEFDGDFISGGSGDGVVHRASIYYVRQPNLLTYMEFGLAGKVIKNLFPIA